MPGYDRFVAYIYLYEQGIRIKNTGFVKVQKREGTCRVEIKLRGAGNASLRSGKVYLFHRDKEQLLGTQIGDMRSANGTGTLQLQLSEENVMESGIPFDEMKGVLIKVSEERIYAAEWDDLGIQVKQFRAAGEEPQQVEAEIIRPFVKSAEVPVKESQTRQEQHKEAQNGVAEPSERAAEPAPAEPSEQAAEPAPAEPPERAAEPAPAEQSERAAEPAPAEQSERAAEPESPERPASRSGRRQQQPSSWKYMTGKFPIFPAFQDDEIHECIRIQPKDLAHLPKKEWSLGNNSFMLHGYYNYKYLIMGRKKEQEKDCIILGVPGVYHNQERAMATMFGFPHFKPARKEEQMQGVFGYWYRIVAIESDS